MITQSGYLSFLIAMTLLGMGISAFIGFSGLHILALGGSEQQVGLAWAVMALPEIPLMYFGGALVCPLQPQATDYRRVFGFCFGLDSGRTGSYARSDHCRSPWHGRLLWCFSG